MNQSVALAAKGDGFCPPFASRDNMMIVHFDLIIGFFAFKTFYHTYNITWKRDYVNIFSVVFLQSPFFGIRNLWNFSFAPTRMYQAAPRDNPGCKVLSGRLALPERGGPPYLFAWHDNCDVLTLTKRRSI